MQNIWFFSISNCLNIKLNFISSDFKNDLQSVFDAGTQFIFAPEPTATSWDGKAYEMVWVNDWDFSYAENSKTQGWNGTILLEQTPNS